MSNCKQSKPANPVLVNTTRGTILESKHRGSYCITNIDGSILSKAGDISRQIYPRSSIKIFQAMPMILSGAVEEFNLTPEEIAVTCASHSGEGRHTKVISNILKKAGLTPDDLECGAHRPTHLQSSEDLIKDGKTFAKINNNCSGKHTGMLLLCKLNGYDTRGYIKFSHPVQQTIMKSFSAILSYDLFNAPYDLDGCSAPTWAIPMDKIAHCFAKISDPFSTLDSEKANAIDILKRSVIENPYMIGGHQRCCTSVMEVLKEDNVFVKVGAEGVYTAAIPAKKLGVVIKIDDGATRAAEVALLRVLEIVGALPTLKKEQLMKFYKTPIFDWKNENIVGNVEPAF